MAQIGVGCVAAAKLADSGLIVVFAMLLLTLAFKPTGLGGGRAR
jgi:hypothetical protein